MHRALVSFFGSTNKVSRVAPALAGTTRSGKISNFLAP
jgi:hypothetical protein